MCEIIDEVKKYEDWFVQVTQLKADLAAMERRAVAAEEDWQAAEEDNKRLRIELDAIRNDFSEMAGAVRLLRELLKRVRDRLFPFTSGIEYNSVLAELYNQIRAELDAGKTEIEQPRVENTLDG